MITSTLQRFTRRLPRSVRPLTPEEQLTRKDRALTQRLFATFERDLELADVHGIHFYVQNGTVTLYGVVRHELDRELLLSLVRQVPGVKGVVEEFQLVDRRFQDLTVPPAAA